MSGSGDRFHFFNGIPQSNITGDTIWNPIRIVHLIDVASLHSSPLVQCMIDHVPGVLGRLANIAHHCRDYITVLNLTCHLMFIIFFWKKYLSFFLNGTAVFHKSWFDKSICAESIERIDPLLKFHSAAGTAGSIQFDVPPPHQIQMISTNHIDLDQSAEPYPQILLITIN